MCTRPVGEQTQSTLFASHQARIGSRVKPEYIWKIENQELNVLHLPGLENELSRVL
jgi:hypothetical protein